MEVLGTIDSGYPGLIHQETHSPSRMICTPESISCTVYKKKRGIHSPARPVMGFKLLILSKFVSSSLGNPEAGISERLGVENYGVSGLPGKLDSSRGSADN